MLVGFLGILLSLFVLATNPVLAYHSKNRDYWLKKFSTDTHSYINEKAYLLGGIKDDNFPDLVKTDLKKAIFEGDSDEVEAHQGSDRSAGSKDNMFGWFGAPDLHWKRILEDYKAGKFSQAYHRIGVLLHLTADATSVSHVRICPHGNGSDRFFTAGKDARTKEQLTYKNDYRIVRAIAVGNSPILAILDWLEVIPTSVHVDGFEKAVDQMASKDQIPVSGQPKQLASPEIYMEEARSQTKAFLDSNSYYDQYWTKKANFESWGTYGPKGDIFGKKIGEEDKKLINFTYNLAVLYSAGQLQLISKKLPPIIEKVSLSPSQFGEEGTALSILVRENRTPTVKLKITFDKLDGPAIEVEERGVMKNGVYTLKLKKGDTPGSLPFFGEASLSWLGKIQGGKVPFGQGRLVVEAIDEDGNSSGPVSIPFEYQGKPEVKEVLDKTVKTGEPPKIEGISYTQLHTDYEESPHRYYLDVQAIDPENGPLSFIWSINCGFFVGPTDGARVEWHYKTPGECINAVVTIKAKDNQDLTAEKTQKVF